MLAQRRLVNFAKYVRLIQNLDSSFQDATVEEIRESGGDCLVCREPMTTGKKLVCGHLFHTDCLRMWLQQQQACPLCRFLFIYLFFKSIGLKLL